MDWRVREPSGLVESPQRPGVFWTHSDSGGGNWLYAIDPQGQLLARARVKGAQNIDWEDITRDDAGYLWLGDIGNNDSQRRDLQIYRLPEPSLEQARGKVEVEFALPFYYPEQDSFGDPLADFDSEALMWWDAQLWLLTKHRSNDLTRLYRFPSLEPPASGEGLALEQVTSFDLGPFLHGERKPWSGQVSAAALGPDGKHWAMLSYEGVFVFALPPSGAGERMFEQLVNRVEFDQDKLRQVEAMAWMGEQLLIINEERAVFVIDEPLTRASYP